MVRLIGVKEIIHVELDVDVLAFRADDILYINTKYGSNIKISDIEIICPDFCKKHGESRSTSVGP